MLKKNVFVLSLFYSLSSFAFDLEDYATTYRATRDAYLKAANEMKLASGPYKAARDGYKQAAYNYIRTLGNGKAELDQSLLATKKRVCIYSSDRDDRSKDKVLFDDKNPVPDVLVDVDEATIMQQEIDARSAYLDALKYLEDTGKAKAAAVQAYKRGTNEYLHSLTLPTDLTLIQRKLIEDKK